jgi:drug/metabolite transporter (DMT)-like permease
MLVLSRSALAAVLLLPLAIRKQIRPFLRYWKPLLAYTIVEIIVPWFFLSTAEQKLPSSTAGLRHRLDEQLRRLKSVGSSDVARSFGF